MHAYWISKLFEEEEAIKNLFSYQQQEMNILCDVKYIFDND